MEHMLWKIAETVGLALILVALIATGVIHTIEYLRFVFAKMKEDGRDMQRKTGNARAIHPSRKTKVIDPSGKEDNQITR
jgi:hypothetical protein